MLTPPVCYLINLRRRIKTHSPLSSWIILRSFPRSNSPQPLLEHRARMIFNQSYSFQRPLCWRTALPHPCIHPYSFPPRQLPFIPPPPMTPLSSQTPKSVPLSKDRRRRLRFGTLASPILLTENCRPPPTPVLTILPLYRGESFISCITWRCYLCAS